MRILGIDPGGHGSLVILDSEFKLIDKLLTPIKANYDMDVEPVYDFLIRTKGMYDTVYLEQVHAIFGSSASGTFNFGRYFGNIEAILQCAKIPYNLVRPKEWQKEIWLAEFLPLKTSEMTPKAKSLGTIEKLAAHLLEPFTIPPKTKRSKPYVHDGYIDASLIAMYGLRKL